MNNPKENQETCATCKHCKRISFTSDFICNNENSDYYTDFVEWDDVCNDWEERD